MKTPWQPINTFKEGKLSIVTNGEFNSVYATEFTDVVKFKVDIPNWAMFWMPIPNIPKKLRDSDVDSYDVIRGY